MKYYEELEFAFNSGKRDQLLGVIPPAATPENLYDLFVRVSWPEVSEPEKWVQAYILGVFSVKPEPVLGKDYGIWLENQ
jgi:hypothetical protein